MAAGIIFTEIFGDTTIKAMVMETVREVVSQIEEAPSLLGAGGDPGEEGSIASQWVEDIPSMKAPGLMASDDEEEEDTCTKDSPSVTGSEEEVEEGQNPLGLWI